MAHSALAADDKLNFPAYLNSKPLTDTPQSGDYLPLVRDNATVKLPATKFLTPESGAAISNKIIDCSINTCINFPSISAPPNCPDTGGHHLNYDNGEFICGSSTPSGETTVAWDDGSTLLWDDGSTLAGL